MASKRIAYEVEGKVQGVFFRDTTAQEADKLGVTGFVQNDSNGNVSGEAQGSADALDSFVKYLHKGPSAAKVSKVSASDIAVKEGESGFSQ